MILWDKDQLWQSDITYIKVGSHYYYLVFIIDVYTKRILGYCASDHLRAEANIIALKMAIKTRGGSIVGLIHHSDKGSQYIDKQYTAILINNGVNISMGLKAQENAYAERVNGIIKNEYLECWDIKTLAELKRKTRKAVEHYNNKRKHSSILRKSPIEFEKEIINLSIQKRPKDIVYAEGNPGIKEALNNIDSLKEEDLYAPVCLLVFDGKLKQKTVNTI